LLVGLKLAITGKGGVGKTTLASLLARLYASEGHRVLAIDADADANLASALGFSAAAVAAITPISQMADLIEERTGARPGSSGKYFKINPRVDDIPERFAGEHAGVRLLLMGGVKKGGGGCICPESVMLKELMRHLVMERDDVVIMDMEAGVEHMGRATAQTVDAMLVVVEPGRRSLQTAETIRTLARDIGIRRCYAVGCKVHDDGERRFIADNLDMPLLGYLAHNPRIAEADLAGRAPYDLATDAIVETRIIRDRLVELLGNPE
jgi:CO dehydrogenase maturation factor